MPEFILMILQKLGTFLVDLMKHEVMVPVWIFTVLWVFTWARK